MNEGILSLHDAQDQHYFDYAFGVKGMGPVIVTGLRPDDDTTPRDHSGISFVWGQIQPKNKVLLKDHYQTYKGKAIPKMFDKYARTIL